MLETGIHTEVEIGKRRKEDITHSPKVANIPTGEEVKSQQYDSAKHDR